MAAVLKGCTIHHAMQPPVPADAKLNHVGKAAGTTGVGVGIGVGTTAAMCMNDSAISE
jgi:hypothetical protein